MLSYYTYGRMPSAEETVYGLGGLDEENVYIPRGEKDVIIPGLPAVEGPVEEFVGTPYMPSFPVIPVAPPVATPSPLAAAEEERVFVPREESVPIAPVEEERALVPREENAPVAPLTQAATAPAPARYDEKGNLLPSADSPLSQSSGEVPQWVKMRQLFGGTPSLIPNLVTAGSGGKDLTTGDLYRIKREQAVKDYEAKVQRFKDAGEFNPSIDESLKFLLNQQLESLAQEEVSYLNQLPQRQTLSNLLRENRFEEAYKFAQDNGMQMLLFRSDQLKNLREPFTKEEAKAFMRAMPYEFFKSAYGDQYEFEKAFKFDPEGAESRGALNWIAFDQNGRPMIQETKEGVKAVQSETGYPMLDKIFELQEVKKDTGIFEKLFKAAAIATAVVGGAQALGALGGGAGGAAGAGGGAGALTGVVPTGVLPGSAAATLGALPTFPIVAGGGITAGQLAAAGALGAAGAGGLGGGTTTTAPVDNLAEIVVTGTKPTTSLLGPGTLASTSLMTPGSVSDIPTDIYGRVTEPVDTVEPPQEEVVITTKPLPVVSPVDLAAVGGLGVLNQTLGQQVGYQRPGIETTPTSEQGLPEVVVTGTKPPALDIADVALGLGGAGALTAGFTQPQVDPFTGELKEPPKTQQELDAIAEALKTGKPIPGVLSTADVIKSAISKYEDLKKLRSILQMLGGLGAAAASSPKGTVLGGLTGGGEMGGALPKYELKRTQLSPVIDYYNYGMGPEAKFFEDVMVETKPSEYETTRGPDASVVNPEDEPRFAHGGLTNYAKGGSHSPRYVAGPGSGRDDKIPALLSDGEYVIDAETLALLGDGSPKEGAARMDKFRANIRQHKGRALSRGRISPNAKSPDKYMGGGLTR